MHLRRAASSPTPRGEVTAKLQIYAEGDSDGKLRQKRLDFIIPFTLTRGQCGVWGAWFMDTAGGHTEPHLEALKTNGPQLPAATTSYRMQVRAATQAQPLQQVHGVGFAQALTALLWGRWARGWPFQEHRHREGQVLLRGWPGPTVTSPRTPAQSPLACTGSPASWPEIFPTCLVAREAGRLCTVMKPPLLSHRNPFIWHPFSPELAAPELSDNTQGGGQQWQCSVLMRGAIAVRNCSDAEWEGLPTQCIPAPAVLPKLPHMALARAKGFSNVRHGSRGTPTPPPGIERTLGRNSPRSQSAFRHEYFWVV